MKAFYRIKDFFSSHNGKILLYCLALIIAVIIVSYARKETKSPSQTTLQPKPSVWDDDSQTSPKTLHTVSKNPSFKEFTPTTLKEDKPTTESLLLKEEPLIIPQPQTLSQTLEPLIKEQRPLASKPQEKPTAKQLPTLEEGAIIHCKLVTPASTDSPNALLSAIITKPVIRNGITVIPKGRLLHGRIQNSQNNRIFFSPSWTTMSITNSPLPLTGYVQQKSHTSSDGRLGLAGTIIAPPQKKTDFLKNLTKGIAQLGKETVKNRVEDYIPATGKNIAIEASSQAIDHLLTQPNQETVKRSPYILIQAGREFYLTISNTRHNSTNHSNKSSLDKLLEEAARKRLGN